MEIQASSVRSEQAGEDSVFPAFTPLLLINQQGHLLGCLTPGVSVLSLTTDLGHEACRQASDPPEGSRLRALPQALLKGGTGTLSRPGRASAMYRRGPREQPKGETLLRTDFNKKTSGYTWKHGRHLPQQQAWWGGKAGGVGLDMPLSGPAGVGSQGKDQVPFIHEVRS